MDGRQDGVPGSITGGSSQPPVTPLTRCRGDSGNGMGVPSPAQKLAGKGLTGVGDGPSMLTPSFS
jgi:hypothetical protein